MITEAAAEFKRFQEALLEAEAEYTYKDKQPMQLFGKTLRNPVGELLEVCFLKVAGSRSEPDSQRRLSL